MSRVVEIGEEITLLLPKNKPCEILPHYCDLQVAYEDYGVIILEKPAGMPTHTSKGNRSTTLENAYLGLLISRGEDVSNFTFHPITRLDGETSGLVLVCKNAVWTAKYSKAMQNGEIAKTYQAIASGKVVNDFTCEIKMGRVEEGKPHRWQSDSGKDSKTLFHIIKSEENNTLLEVIPRTGRTHQIRVHLAFSGHAIVGDKLYQNGGILQGEKPTSRLMLHMHKLQFKNCDGNYIEVCSSQDFGDGNETRDK